MPALACSSALHVCFFFFKGSWFWGPAPEVVAGRAAGNGYDMSCRSPRSSTHNLESQQVPHHPFLDNPTPPRRALLRDSLTALGPFPPRQTAGRPIGSEEGCCGSDTSSSIKTVRGWTSVWNYRMERVRQASKPPQMACRHEQQRVKPEGGSSCAVVGTAEGFGFPSIHRSIPPLHAFRAAALDVCPPSRCRGRNPLTRVCGTQLLDL